MRAFINKFLYVIVLNRRFTAHSVRSGADLPSEQIWVDFLETTFSHKLQTFYVRFFTDWASVGLSAWTYEITRQFEVEFDNSVRHFRQTGL